MYTPLDDAYYQRIVGVMEYAATLDAHKRPALLEQLTERCPECSQIPTGLDAQLHRMHDGTVIIGCEGYWVINPELVGLDTGTWMDFRDDIEDMHIWKETGLNG